MQKQKGFTLVELVVVMAIIAVLAALAIFAINAARLSARNTTRRSNAHTMQVALESYFSANKAYPTNGAAPVSAYTLVTGTGALVSYAPGFNGTNDPNGSGENGRLCYNQNTSSKYWLWMLPEPATYAACPSTMNAVGSGSYEDYSVQ